jgi:hypothetical protein
LFEDDFESATVGQAPEGWDTFIAYQANPMMNPQGSGEQALVETAQKKNGAQAVHFIGSGQPAMITRALPEGTTRVVVTAWVWMSRQLGNQTDPSQNHETLIGIRGTPADANNEIRFGEIKGAIGVNEVPSDNISPTMDQWYSGPSVPAETWACMEIAFFADQPQHEMFAWVDDELLLSVTMGNEWQNGEMPPTWMFGKDSSNRTFEEVILGWHSFSSNTVDVWMDDVVVSTDRVGCR